MVNPAQRLEALRTEKNISRVQLASELGFPKTTIEKFETSRLTPNKEQYEKLAKYFGVSAAYLKCEIDEPGGAAGWLSGNVKEDEPVRPALKTRSEAKAALNSTAKEREDGAVFNLLLKSEAFKSAVLEVLKSPEGRELIIKAMKK